jgi:xylulokinase
MPAVETIRVASAVQSFAALLSRQELAWESRVSMFILAHDIGTTGDKATLFNGDGRIVASTFAPYSTYQPRPGWAEQHPDDWWRAVCGATRFLVSRTPNVRRHLAAVSFSAMMNGCLLLDDSGRPLRPCLIHADIRSGEDCRLIASKVPPNRAYDLTGNRLAPYFTLSKLAWISRAEPDIVARARWCVQAKDYLVGRLTGVWGITDRSDASLTGCFDIKAGAWSHELAEAGGFPVSLLPEVLTSATIIGAVTPGAATATHLPAGTPVVLGGGDGACATAGAAATAPGDAYHYLGGTSWIAAVTDGYQPDPARRMSVFCGLDPGLCVLYGTSQSAGSSVDWFRKAIGVGEVAPGTDEFQALEHLAGSAPAGSRGLFFLPYLSGERSPIWDASARGVFFGLSAAHGRADMARAVFEGVAYALASNLDVLNELGMAPSVLRVLGGGMRTRLWRTIFAAMYNRPVQLLEHLAEATSCGAAMAAAVAIGLYPDYARAADRFAPIGALEAPDPLAAQIYARRRPLFRKLYPALAGAFHDLADLETGE